MTTRAGCAIARRQRSRPAGPSVAFSTPNHIITTPLPARGGRKPLPPGGQKTRLPPPSIRQCSFPPYRARCHHDCRPRRAICRRWTHRTLFAVYSSETDARFRPPPHHGLRYPALSLGAAHLHGTRFSQLYCLLLACARITDRVAVLLYRHRLYTTPHIYHIGSLVLIHTNLHDHFGAATHALGLPAVRSVAGAAVPGRLQNVRPSALSYARTYDTPST